MASVSLSTSRVIAPAAFAFNIVCQIYGGLVARPSIVDIHNLNLSFFSPSPAFIALASISIVSAECWWLWQLLRINHTSQENTTLINIDFLPYVPINVLGNICIGLWVFPWVSSHLIISDLFLVVSLVAHLYYIYFSPNMGSLSPEVTKPRATLLVLKIYGGLGFLDTLHNSSMAFAGDVAPGIVVKVLTAVVFLTMVAFGDAFFGAYLTFDLLALSAGQAKYADSWTWSGLLAVYALASAVLVGGKHWIW